MLLNLPEIAIGAIFAAIIASSFSFLGLIIAKEQKTSEFRQDWINSLRNEISQFISAANSIYAVKFQEAGRSEWKEIRDDFISINEATANIRLRLNPEEDLSKNILDKINEIENLFHKDSPLSAQELNEKEKELVLHVSILLKTEWDRVKRGEPIYQWAKWCALGLFAIASVIVGLSLTG